MTESMPAHKRGASLLVTCHPSPTNLCSRVARLVAEVLQANGADVMVDDLHEISFDPVLSRSEFAGYCEEQAPGDIAPLVDHLRSAEELIFILPLWMYDMPAILKGYFDRVWRPHVSFAFDGARIRPLLTGIKHLSVVVSHGRGKAECDLVGDGTRSFFAVSLPSVLPNLETNTRFDLYALDHPDASAIEDALDRIRRHFASR
ncbi:MAG: NAD(P)H-dependent oxidoreductase [Hyphomicrobium sp.]|uniref:NAD(P)H-dependent oxidoreductase n=1 Tax=Hyphomicrobium sp. TaxID=82 RepID=UPI003D0FD8AB